MPGLAQSALAALCRLPGTQRALVLTQGSGQLVVRRLHGTVEPHELTGSAAPPGFALTRAVESNKSVLSLDLAQDSAFSACPRRHEVRSVLCVPIPGRQGPAGFLYADHPDKPGAFSHAELREVEEFARRLGPELEDAMAQTRPRAEERSDHHRPLIMGVVVVLVALLWGGTGVMMHASAPPPPPPPIETLTKATPSAVCASFLGLVKLGQYSQAYQLLAAPVRARVPLPRFEKETADWLKTGSHLWELDYRRPGAGAVTGRRAEVPIEPAPGGQPWKYQLVQEDNGAWKLDRWDGGPLGH